MDSRRRSNGLRKDYVAMNSLLLDNINKKIISKKPSKVWRNNMKKLEIEIGDIQYRLLQKYAQGNHTTSEQYATNIIVTWINSHIEGHFAKKMKTKGYDELELFFGEVEP